MAKLTAREELEYLELLEEEYKDNARSNILDFTTYTMGKNGDNEEIYRPTEFHRNYCKVIDAFVRGDIKKLFITVPPQFGKSEISTRRLPALLLGLNPELKIAITSYSTTQARKFNRDVQRIIDSEVYTKLFPGTTINGKNVVTTSSYLRNADEFEVIDHAGGLKAVGRGGALTGNTVDRLIIDDIFKDDMEGNSPVIRDNVINWYNTVAESRLHNNSQQLIVFTRWHEEDLIGYLEKKDKVLIIESLDDIQPNFDGWYKLNYEAIMTKEPTELDSRDKGLSLWEDRHSVAKLKKTKDRDPHKFECLYQGNPESASGRLYAGFRTYDVAPRKEDTLRRLNYTDTADTGDDFLCSIVYDEGKDGFLYVLDILYTVEDMDKTEGWTASMLDRWKVNKANIESNNGGRGFARNVKKAKRGKTVISWFHQGDNKESRIFSNSALVQELILFPSDWAVRFPDFYSHVIRYKRIFSANKHDDAPDTLTGMVELLSDDRKGQQKALNSW